MASKLSFRQHILLLLFIDILVVLFMLGNNGGILFDFISNPGGLSFTAKLGLGGIIVALFVGFSQIGVTSGSNFSGIAGVIAGGFGIAKKTAGDAIAIGTLLAVIVDYIFIYNLIINGQSFGWMNIIGMIIFVPLIVDACFSAIDWVRGTNT